MTERDLELHEPIKRGDDEITGFDIRRPKAGELRGVTVTDIIRMDVASTIKVLPRITVPPITPEEAANLDPFDLGEAAAQVSDFFTEPPKKKESNEPSQKTSSTGPQTSPSSSVGDQETSGNLNSKSSSTGGDAPAKS